MATYKQRKAVDKIIENNGNVGKAMIDAGYEPNSAKVPGNLTKSKGYKELCEEYGLTDELLLGALVSDIEGKPKRRVKELQLGFKVKGRLETNEITEKSNVNIIVFNERDSNTLQFQSGGKTLPVGDIKKSIKVQEFNNPQESREDSTSS